MSTSMAVLSSRTRSNSPKLYRPRKYSSPPPTKAKTTPSSPIFALSPATPRSIRFSVDQFRTKSPARSHRSIGDVIPIADQKTIKKACLCSPTTHRGSFRCSMHKKQNQNQNQNQPRGAAMASRPSDLTAVRRSAMANSLIRIGAVEGDFVKRALAALIRPSSHHQRRHAAFQPRPSRLSVMSRAGEN